MNILVVHNRYRERGGEDVVFETEATLLRRHGHDVTTLEFANDSIDYRQSPGSMMRLGIETVWSRRSAAIIDAKITIHRPAIAHFHNTFPLVSPSVYSVCRKHGVATVQTLHNYRLLCPSAVLYRDGNVCEECVGRTAPIPGIFHACYRNSYAQSAVVGAMLATHRLRGTWDREIDCYLALTNFSRDKHIEGGIPADLIAVKPNFLANSAYERHGDGTGFLFVGRLTAEKGILTLLRAWELSTKSIQLRIAGDGPLRSTVAETSAHNPLIEPIGSVSRTDVHRLMTNARALIFPSEWYEGFPVTLVEAFAYGLPVIASRLGSMAEIVEDGRTGLLFNPGDAEDLVAKVAWAWEHPNQMRTMGDAARQVYESKYTPERNYTLLMDIYRRAIDHRRADFTSH